MPARHLAAAARAHVCARAKLTGAPSQTRSRVWDEEEERARAVGDAADDGAPPPADPAEFLERLSRAMGGGAGSLSAWQSGRLDPFGTSSSEAWFRRVEQQRSSPFASRPGGDFGRGLGGDRLRGNPEWEPFRPGGGEDEPEGLDGWRRPGQRPEWGRRPERGGDEDGRGGGGGSRPIKGDDFRRGGGGGGGFRGR